ncbi:MAG: hypothetical protein R3C44_07105 [Chloroflexota bacterium]
MALAVATLSGFGADAIGAMWRARNQEDENGHRTIGWIVRALVCYSS